MQETQVRSLGQEDPLEKGMATYSSTEEPGGLQSMGSQRVEPDWVTKPSHHQDASSISLLFPDGIFTKLHIQTINTQWLVDRQPCLFDTFMFLSARGCLSSPKTYWSMGVLLSPSELFLWESNWNIGKETLRMRPGFGFQEVYDAGQVFHIPELCLNSQICRVVRLTL